METAGLVGSSSAVDSQAWQEVMQHRMPTSTTRPPSILETGATCQSSAIPHLHAWNVSLHDTCKPPGNVSALMLLSNLLLLMLHHFIHSSAGLALLPIVHSVHHILAHSLCWPS